MWRPCGRHLGDTAVEVFGTVSLEIAPFGHRKPLRSAGEDC